MKQQIDFEVNSDANPMERSIYAIGDVHGCADQLEKVIEFIRVNEYGTNPPLIYFLGDIIDRGTDSKRSLKLVIDALEEFPGSRLIRGNHDSYLWDWLEDEFIGLSANRRFFDFWLNERIGGLETIRSLTDQPGFDNYPYNRKGMPDPTLGGMLDDYLKLLSEAKDISQVKATNSKGDQVNYVFVHAGICPHHPLPTQAFETTQKGNMSFNLDWIEPGADESMIVFYGHHIIRTGMPHVTRNKVGLDTGSFLSGRLSFVLLNDGPTDGNDMLFFQTRPENPENTDEEGNEISDIGPGDVRQIQPKVYKWEHEKEYVMAERARLFWDS